MFWGFLAAFVVSSFLLVRNLIQKQQAAKIYKDIQEEFFSTGYSFDVSEAFRTDRSQTPGLEEDREQRSIHTLTELLNGAENDADLMGADSSGGTREVNERLANARANAVKDLLIKKYKIASDRIDAQGLGVGDMFSEPDWNRVSVCYIITRK